MAIQILNDSPSLGAAVGTGLGQGLSNILNILAQNKLQKLAQRQQTPFWQQLGLAPEVAQSIASQPESLQREILSRLEGASLGGQQQPSGIQQSLEALQHLTPFSPEEIQRQEQVSQQPQGLTIGPSKQERMHRERLAQQRELAAQKMSAQEKREAFKITKEERKDINQKAKAARQTLHDLERLEELEKEGKLDTPGYVEFLKRSGLDIPALMNPGSEEYNKITQNFMRGAKEIFGARVTNTELEQFLKSIPTLSQSPEGRKRVIANMKYINRAALEYNHVLKKILAENNGIPPFDLAEKVDDRVEKKLNKLSKQLKKDLAKPVPESQDQLITALQAALGSVIGAPGKLLGGVGHLLSAL